MRRGWTGVAVACAVAGAVAGLDVTGAPARVARPVAAAAATPVAGAARVCSGVTHDTRISLAFDPPSGRSGPGPVSLIPVPPGPAQTLRVAPRTTVVQASPPRGSVDVVAHGPAAAGLEAETLQRTAAGSGRGLLSARCASPAASWWFTGASGALGAADALLLTNVDPVPALVDVQLWGDQGEIRAPSAQGIEVPPHGRVSVPIDSLAPDVATVGLHVVARAGRVAALVHTARSSGGKAQGVGWLPPTVAPAREQVVPGLLPPYDDAELYITNPGDRDAQVTVRVVGRKGAFVPTGFKSLTVPAGTTQRFQVTDQLDGSADALQVDSDVPVALGGLTHAVDSSTGIGEGAWTAAVAPLDGPALVTDDRVDQGNRSLVALTTTDRPATVRVATLRPSPLKLTTVTIPAGRTAVVDIGTLLPADRRFDGVSVTPQPGSGPVWAARQIYEHGAHGPLLTVLPLQSAPRTVPLPAAVEDPRAGTTG